MKHDLISPTALLVAYMRARTDIPYCAELAELCQARETAESIMEDDLPAFVEFRGPYTELRYKALDAAIAHFGADCVLELASGLSPRGLSSPLPYLETDLPDMLAAKEKLARSLHQRPEHRFAAVDVMDADALKKAADSLPGERLAIVNEGLLLYFDPDEKRRAAQNIRAILRERPGSAWLTTDVYLRSRYMALIGSHPRVANAVRRLRQATARDLTENAFADNEEALAFFEGQGFRVERLNQRQFVPQLVLESHDEAILEILRQEEVWLMSV